MKSTSAGSVRNILLILVAIVILVAAYIFWTRNSNSWKTYTNRHYSIQYPSNWSVKEEGAQTIFRAPGQIGSTDGGIIVNMVQTETAKPLNNARGIIDTYSKMLGANAHTSSLTIDGQSATLIDMQNASIPLHAMRIVFDHNANTYEILEAGPAYYHSPTFETFYRSFRFRN